MTIGKVYLVGAGPGDPGLLTVRGLDLLRSADVIVYDHLVHPAIVAEASDTAAKIYVGKQAGRHCAAQADINRILIEYACAGCEVVRLKGGDPFVFGRGGEEAAALAEAGIPFEIVPGVSSAVAVPAYAGIPLTHRGVASSFAVVTGHPARNADSAIDWPKLACAVDTLVVLMGLKNLPRIAAEMLAGGISPATPAAVICQGTTHGQESVTGTLADIAARAAHLQSPAVIVMGRVVELSSRLQWFATESMLRESIAVQAETVTETVRLDA